MTFLGSLETKQSKNVKHEDYSETKIPPDAVFELHRDVLSKVTPESVLACWRSSLSHSKWPYSSRPLVKRSYSRASTAIIVWLHSNEIFMCMIKRRVVGKKDVFSGHVAFPGGKAEDGEMPFDTAVRETKEELGVDLLDSRFFRHLGELDCREFIISVHPPALTIVSPVIFEYTSSSVQPFNDMLSLCDREVASVRWVPTFSFALGRSPYSSVPFYLSFANHILPKSTPPSLLSAARRLSLHLMIPNIHFPRSIVMDDRSQDADSSPFITFGLTLRSLLSLYEHIGIPRVIPFTCTSNNLYLNHLIHSSYATSQRAIQAAWDLMNSSLPDSEKLSLQAYSIITSLVLLADHFDSNSSLYPPPSSSSSLPSCKL